MITGWKTLTENERAHLRETGIHTNCDAMVTFRKQAQYRADSAVKGFKTEPCWDCYFLARRLGYTRYTLDILRDWAGWLFMDLPVDILWWYNR